MRFISFLLCSYLLKFYKSSEVYNYVMSLEVEGKVDILMGFVFVLMKYCYKDELFSKWEIMFLFFLVFVRKGFFFFLKGLLKYFDKGMDFNVEGIEIGMEDILIVILEYERWGY